MEALLRGCVGRVLPDLLYLVRRVQVPDINDEGWFPCPFRLLIQSKGYTCFSIVLSLHLDKLANVIRIRAAQHIM